MMKTTNRSKKHWSPVRSSYTQDKRSAITTRPYLNARSVRVQLLSDEELNINVDVKSQVKDVFQIVCAELELEEQWLFGLAIIRDGEYIYLEGDSKLSKFASKQWKSGNITEGDDVKLHFRVKQYVADASSIRTKAALHQYQLQLQQNTLNYGLLVTAEWCFIQAARALQSMLGPYNPATHRGTYFKPKSHFPSWVIEKFGEEYIYLNTPALHRELGDSSRRLTLLAYCSEATRAQLNVHLCRVRRLKSEIDMWLAVRPDGLQIYEEQDGGIKLDAGLFAWDDISKLYFEKKRFEVLVRGRCDEDVHRFSYVTPGVDHSRSLLLLCRAVHERTLTHTDKLNNNCEDNRINERYVSWRGRKSKRHTSAIRSPVGVVQSSSNIDEASIDTECSEQDLRIKHDKTNRWTSRNSQSSNSTSGVASEKREIDDSDIGEEQNDGKDNSGPQSNYGTMDSNDAVCALKSLRQKAAENRDSSTPAMDVTLSDNAACDTTFASLQGDAHSVTSGYISVNDVVSGYLPVGDTQLKSVDKTAIEITEQSDTYQIQNKPNTTLKTHRAQSAPKPHKFYSELRKTIEQHAAALETELKAMPDPGPTSTLSSISKPIGHSSPTEHIYANHFPLHCVEATFVQSPPTIWSSASEYQRRARFNQQYINTHIPASVSPPASPTQPLLLIQPLSAAQSLVPPQCGPQPPLSSGSFASAPTLSPTQVLHPTDFNSQPSYYFAPTSNSFTHVDFRADNPQLAKNSLTAEFGATPTVSQHSSAASVSSTSTLEQLSSSSAATVLLQDQKEMLSKSADCIDSEPLYANLATLIKKSEESASQPELNQPQSVANDKDWTTAKNSSSWTQGDVQRLRGISNQMSLPLLAGLCSDTELIEQLSVPHYTADSSKSDLEASYRQGRPYSYSLPDTRNNRLLSRTYISDPGQVNELRSLRNPRTVLSTPRHSSK